MKRNKKIVLVAHCLLNSNSKVEGLAQYEGALKEAVNLIIDSGVGIVQLPCPELSSYGIKRWGHVKEQFDTPYFREHCREIFGPYLKQIKDYLAADYEILALIGIDGSPSCGVNKTCSGKWGGEFLSSSDLKKKIDTLSFSKEPGVFIEEIIKILKQEKIEIPIIAIDEENPQNIKNKIQKIL